MRADRPRAYARAELDALAARAQRRETNYYDSADKGLYAALDDMRGLDGLSVGVLGSLEPWRRPAPTRSSQRADTPGAHS